MQTKNEAEGATAIMLQQYCEIPVSSWAVRYTALSGSISSILLFTIWPMCVSICVQVLSLGFRLRNIHLISMVDETTHESPVRMAQRDNFIWAVGEVSRPSAALVTVCPGVHELILFGRSYIVKKMLKAVSEMGTKLSIWLHVICRIWAINGIN